MSNSKLSEYIKHTRHFDGLGMGDQDLEGRAKKLESCRDALILLLDCEYTSAFGKAVIVVPDAVIKTALKALHEDKE